MNEHAGSFWSKIPSQVYQGEISKYKYSDEWRGALCEWGERSEDSRPTE